MRNSIDGSIFFVVVLVILAVMLQGWAGLLLALVAFWIARNAFIFRRSIIRSEKRYADFRAEMNTRQRMEEIKVEQDKQTALRIDAATNKVYFILNSTNNTVKIGVSQNPTKRMADLQTSSAHPLTLLTTTPGGYALEHKLHRRFARYRLTGEWFRMGNELDMYIQQVKTRQMAP